MVIEESPPWQEMWEDEAVFAVYLWAENDLRTWFRLRHCDVLEALDWARVKAAGESYSVALLVADPTERPPGQDGRIWLLGGNVRAGDGAHRD